MRIAVQPCQRTARGCNGAVNGIDDHVFLGVDELFHGALSLSDARAIGGEVEWLSGADADDIAFFQVGMRVRHRDQVVGFERQMQAGLVA